MARKKKESTATPEWWTEPVEVARADTPSAKKLKNRTKLYRRFIIAGIFLLPFSLLATFVAVAGGGDDAPASVSGPPATEATAISAVQAWIDQDPSPLPGGRVVVWNSYRSTDLPTGKDAPEGISSVEVHTLTLSAATGALFKTNVQIAVGDSIGEVVLSAPTLIPLAPAANDSNVTSALTPWPTLETSTATEGAETAIQVWAKAFTSGDPATLLNAVGDERSNVSYVPLSGLTLNTENYNIDSVGAIYGDDQDRSAPGLVPETMVITVQFEGTWAGTTPDLNTEPPTFTYDLLITKANTASPRVVAWGGQGSGAWLEPFANSVRGTVVAAPAAVPEGDGTADSPTTPQQADPTGDAATDLGE